MEIMLSVVSNIPSRVYGGWLRPKYWETSLFSAIKRVCNCGQTLESGCGAHSRNFGRASPLGDSNAMVKTCSGYIKHSPRSGKHSALWIRAARRLKQFISKERWILFIFWKIESRPAWLNWDYSTCFFWKFLTLRAPRNFSRQVENMFWVCETFS